MTVKRIQAVETVMTYDEWKRIYKKRKWKRAKAKLLEAFAYSIPLWAAIIMIVHWITFGY